MWGCFSCHYIMHNGEINTIRGNADRMLAWEETMHSALLSDEDMDKVLPVVDQSGSDSAMLDNTLEFLMMNGIDLPLAVLSEAHQPLFNYFKQLFAQVTNPPIDAIREKIVTDTTVFVGSNGNLLEELPENCEVLQIKNPILTSVELLKIKYMDNPGFRAETISLLYYKSTPLENAVERLFVACDRAYSRGANILILSDRGVDENHVAIPSLLAVSAIQHYLVRTKKRTAVSLILESAEPRDVHHFATLIGYGAQAINPYLAQECVEELVSLNMLDKDPGAAPRTSIHNAGLPWELGVAEAHQTLIQNGLRSRVIIEADGKLMTGWDVAIACMLGAEEFGFATAPLVAMGCCMMRVCNLDTCPAGIATQNPELRRRFAGKPEYIINFMHFVAEELRENMALLGIRTVDELVGRSDLLRVRDKLITHRAETLDLSGLLSNPYGARVPHFDPREVYDFHLEDTKSAEITNKLAKSLKGKKAGRLNVTVSSTDRTFGTLFGSEITRQCGNELPEDSYVISCRGGGGQSFGAFIPKGLTIRLEGDANDGFGKGLSGGKLVLYPPKGSAFEADQNIIVGNVALYGATSGKAFIAGVAGERFCVRNSGASAVVEGVGDHGCEYMTGGRAVILGNTGKNFAAGMSGGIAYVLDERHDLYMRMNKGGVSIDTLKNPQDIQELRELIEEHVKETGSEKGKRILADFDAYIPRFKKITPRDYERMTKAILANEKQGMSREEAEIKAFYAAVRK